MPSDACDWEKDTQEKFDRMIANVPAPMRGLAKNQISKKAFKLAQANSRGSISEKDMVNAFFEITPFGFHGPMKTDMKALGIDYKQYGHT